jgi:hypothetical protein
MKTLILLLTISSSILFAQNKFYFSLYTGFGQTSIYNKEDTKGHTYKYPAAWENPLGMTPTVKFNLGFETGMYWAKEKTGLQSLTAGIGSMMVQQNYTETKTQFTNRTGGAVTKLYYLNLPWLATFRIGNSKKIVPTVSAGISFLNLRTNSDEYKATDLDNFTGSNYTIIKTVNKNQIEYSESDPIYNSVITLNEVPYKKYVYCTNIAIGCDYHITENILVNASIYNLYSINDPEVRTPISGYRSNKPNLLQEFLPNNEVVNKVYFRAMADRPTTHIINTGAQIKFIYLFDH